MTTKNKPTSASEIGPVIALDVVHTYQSVAFNKRQETHFTAKRQGMEGIRLTYDSAKQIVVIDLPGKDLIYVMPPNVAYMKPVGAISAVDEAFAK